MFVFPLPAVFIFWVCVYVCSIKGKTRDSINLRLDRVASAGMKCSAGAKAFDLTFFGSMLNFLRPIDKCFDFGLFLKREIKLFLNIETSTES